ncbi:MAG TPA: hypothetical protein VGS41_08365, partial [Chthonomonadales bacterium]|nr:hypothetical protein [Chthonomonadales bacterium]
AVRHADLAIIEANHDPGWLARGPYPPELKARVASRTGHLSNQECGALIAERLSEQGPLTVWLAHLSRVNNSPRLARACVEAAARATGVPLDLRVALRDHPSVSWRYGSGAVQLKLM